MCECIDYWVYILYYSVKCCPLGGLWLRRPFTYSLSSPLGFTGGRSKQNYAMETTVTEGETI